MASNRLTREQVVDVFRTNKVSVSFEPMKVDDLIETINHFACVRLLVEQITAPLTQDFIKRLHKMLYYGTYADRKKEVRLGEYRKEPRSVGVQPVFIKQEMTRLIAEYESVQAITFEALLDFHVRFEEIHPFDDGNGRVGRLILIKECLRFGIDPFIIDDKHRGNYNQGIAEWPKDHTLLTGVCLEAQERLNRQRELCKLMQFCRSPIHGQS
jgi:Fic family protein